MKSRTSRKPGRFIIAWLLAAVIFATIMPATTAFASSTPIPDTGWYYDNSAGTDFTISTANQLAGLAQIVNSGTDSFTGKTVTLGDDIDLTAYGTGYNSGAGWTPIGASGKYFSGTFDGDGHKVLNLHISGIADNSGFFGIISSANIVGLGIESAYVKGSMATGGLVGKIESGSIARCYYSGTVEGGFNTGGLVGESPGFTSITDCYSTGTVNGSNYVGGLVGRSGANVLNCYSTASVYASSKVGGLIGDAADGTRGSVTSSAALNSVVQGNNSVGRISPNITTYYQFNGNAALDSMSNGTGGAFEGGNTHDGLGGADISSEQVESAAFWTTAAPNWEAWDTDVWQFSDGGLPAFKPRNTPVIIPEGVTLVADTAGGEPGDEVDITVSLVDNPGVAGFSLVLGYDSSLLTPLSVTKNSALGGSVFVSNVNEIEDKSSLGGEITAVWAASQDVNVEELFTIRFRIGDVSIDDGEDIVTPVNVYIEELKYLSRQDVQAERQHGSVTINGPEIVVNTDLWGDVTVNDVVDIYDLIRFAKHTAEIPSEELTERGLYLADVDRNSDVD
ncbi:MAG: hypothetical protein LBS21_09570, partial [Clostridiales bacterium]|nr:hypothetical protein [Clostridiales bacterium]